MKIRAKWTIAAVLVFIIFVIAYLPASQVVGRITLPENVSVGEVSGTVWDGRAQFMVIEGFTVLNVRWEINPWMLLLGELQAHLRGGNIRETDEIAFKGPLSINLISQETLSAEDFTVYLPVDRVLAEVPLPLPVNAGGRFRLQLEELTYGAECRKLKGIGEWLNATVAGTQGPIDFGNYSARLSCREGKIAMAVAEPNKLGLSLNALVGADFNTVEIEGQFRPDPALPKEVHQAALLFGRPDADGYTRISL